MFADIPLTLAGDHLIGIDQYQPINTVIEIGIDPEIEETDPAGFTEFTVLLVERRYGYTEEIKLFAQTTEIFSIVVTAEQPADGSFSIAVQRVRAA